MRARRGYTLMELLLVLAIIVVAAAAVAPSFRGVMRNASLKSAADTVRADLTRAHVLAMKTGRTQVFQYELGGDKYKIERWAAGDEELEGAGGETTPVPPPPSALAEGLLPGERKLPEGTKFVMGDSAMETRGQRIEEELMSMGGAGANWSRPILFFPDGSSVDAFIIVGNEFDRGIRVELRGMTGAVRVGNASDLQQLEEGQAVGR
jgi:prepilin-type N-terminal cleavage/methylation domain-containing protein